MMVEAPWWEGGTGGGGGGMGGPSECPPAGVGKQVCSEPGGEEGGGETES